MPCIFRSGRPWLRIASAFAVTVLLATPSLAFVGAKHIDLPQTGSYALLYVPPSAPTQGPVPLIVFLHGANSRPEDYLPLLETAADALSVPLLLPKSGSPLGWGPGDDRAIIDEALAAAGGYLDLDPRRISIAGHSSGGAYAIVRAYSEPNQFAGVFALSAPYRTIVSLGVHGYIPPLHLYYGTEDPNYVGSLPPLRELFNRLGINWETDIETGHGHNDWPESSLEDGFRFLLDQRYSLGGPCLPTSHRLCLAKGRFAVEASWGDFDGHSGQAFASPSAESTTGFLWFFAASNLEMLVKVIDGCNANGRYWVLASGATNVAYTLHVTDLATGRDATFTNPLGTRSPAIVDTATFNCN